MPRHVSILTRTTSAVAAALALVVLAASPVAAQTTPSPALGTVVIVHGFEGIPADVYVDGAPTPALAAFDFRRVTDPLALPVGAHSADIRRAGDPSNAAPVMSGSFEVVADQQTTIVALLDDRGDPSWLAFLDDHRPAPEGTALLRLRHIAATGPVVFSVDGVRQPMATNLAGGAQLNPVAVTPGSHQVEVFSALDNRRVLGPQSVDVGAGTMSNVYLTGREENSTLALLEQSPPALSPAAQVLAAQVPNRIASGNSGLRASADPEHSVAPGVAVAIASGLAAVLMAANVIAGSRRRRVRVVASRRAQP